MKNLIRFFSENPVIAGRENKLFLEIASKLSGYHSKIDRMGNLILYRGNAVPKNPILVTAGADVPGFFYTASEDDGRVRVSVADFISDMTIHVGRKYRCGALSGKILSDSKADTIAVKNLYLDFGFKTREEAEKSLFPGDGFVPEIKIDISDNKIIGISSSLMTVSAVLYKVAETNSRDDVVFAFASANTAGGRGMKTLSNELNPTLSFLLKSTESNSVAPLILYKDGIAFSHLETARKCEDILISQGIDCKPAITENSYVEARQLQVNGIGTRTVSIGLPVQNNYTDAETVVEESATSLYAAVSAIINNM